MVKVRITEKDREPNCGDPETCCGYSYVQGCSDTVEMDEATFEKLNADVDYLYGYETVYPEDYGIKTNLDNIGWVELGD